MQLNQGEAEAYQKRHDEIWPTSNASISPQKQDPLKFIRKYQ